MLTDAGTKFNVMEYVRTTSIGCVQEPQANALIFLKNGDLRSFTDIINSSDVEAGASNEMHWINLPVEGDSEESTLLEAAVRMKKYPFVKNLVRVGAIRDQLNTKTGLTPLHTACQEGDDQMLAILVGNDDKVDPNVRSSDRKGGWTPLHFAAQSNSGGHLKCLEYLLDNDDVDVDARDNRAIQTPLFVAVDSKNEQAIKALIKNGANLDTKCGRKTIREYLAENLPNFDPKSIRVVKSREIMLNLEDKMMDLLKITKKNGENERADLANFRTYTRFIKSLEDPSSLNEVFNLACEKGLHEHVLLLLKKGVSPNNRDKPILEAAYKGYFKVLDVLVKDPRTDLLVEKAYTKETILHLILKKEFEQASHEDYENCFRVLIGNSKADTFKQISGIINKKDDLGNTPLHYATQKWSETTVRKLLELGANIGIKNHWKEIPITKIRPQTMEDFLDEFCLTYEGDIMHENFNLTFHYEFLAPDAEALPPKYRKNMFDYEEQSLIRSSHDHAQALPETECLWYMGQSKEHRHLLKHPVITSFLWYKWQRIRKYFNRNLRLYFLFVFLLTWYIFEHFGSYTYSNLTDTVFYVLFILMFAAMVIFMVRDWVYDLKDFRRTSSIKDVSQRRNPCIDFTKLIMSNWVEALMLASMVAIIIFGSSLLKLALTILLAILLLIEVFQLMVSLKRYVFSIENWIEVSMIIIVSIILYNEENSFDLNRNLAAISILLSWSKVITLIGKHPKHNRFNIYVTMFFKVLKSFFFFLSWYGLFIIAFGFSFFIMLHNDVKDAPKENGDEEYVFFNTTFLSVVKTLTMFVGELEFSDIPIDLESPFAQLNYLFFLCFVFLIVVVLMNLLNGLAVSDTGAIQEKAEIYSYLSRVETISYLESVLLGDPFDFLSNVPRFFSFLPSCSLFRQLYRSNMLKQIFTQMGASSILLFYNYLPEKKSPKLHPNTNSEDCSCLSVDEMGLETIAAAKNIIANRVRMQNRVGNEPDFSEVIARMEKIEDKLASLANFEAKLDLLIQKLN